MTTPNILNLSNVEWEPHPRFKALRVKVLESKATHPHASVMLVEVEAGGEIPAHTHPIETETAYVLAGQGVITIDGQDYVFEGGHNLTIPVGALHSVRNTGSGAISLLAIHTPPVR
jgi:quercetin dioxygenase-like cupin family protein